MLAFSLAAIATLGIGVWSLAWSASKGDAFTECISRTSSNKDWADCGDKEIARQDSRLNAAWKKAFACFDQRGLQEQEEWGSDAKGKFLEEQRLWVKWKNAACKAINETGFFSSEVRATYGVSCKIDILRQRADWLERFVKSSRTCSD